jgi:hypothetical protein
MFESLPLETNTFIDNSTVKFKHSTHNLLWNDTEEIKLILPELSLFKQKSKSCVPTCLAAITSISPEKFYHINSQDPKSWSLALKEYKLKLAYCCYDFRKLKFYQEELLNYDGIFIIGLYTRHIGIISKDYDPTTICPSHCLVLFKNKIYDPQEGNLLSFDEKSKWNEMYVKRIFRVVPIDYSKEI